MMADPAEAEQNAGAEQGKTFDISCPHCGQTLQGSESIAGMTVECPYCLKTFVAPAAPDRLPASASQESLQSDSATAKQTCPQKESGVRGAGSRRFRMIIKKNGSSPPGNSNASKEGGAGANTSEGAAADAEKSGPA